MSDLDHLYQQIVDTPHDNILRLAYADALAESGDDEHADFIQLQIEPDCPESRARAQSLWPSVGTRTVRAPAGWKVSKGGRKKLYVNLDYPTEWGWSYIRAYAANGFCDCWEADQRTWDRLGAAVRATNPVRELRLNCNQHLVYEGDDTFRFEREPDRLYSIAEVEEVRGRYRGPKPSDDIGLLHLLRNPGLVVSERLNRIRGRAADQEYGVKVFRQEGLSPLIVWQSPPRERRLEQMASFCESEGFPPGTRIAAAAWTTGGRANDFYRHDPRVRHYPPELTPQSA